MVNKCTLCPLGGASHVVHTNVPARTAGKERRTVLPENLPDSLTNGIKYLLVGESPGGEENLQGVPFVGKSGQLLDNILNKLADEEGLDLNQVLITNAIKCQPVNNSKAPIAYKRTCRQHYLDKEIEAFKPEVIIALGGHALGSLLDTSTAPGVGGLRLKNVESVYAPIPTVVTYHPAYILRDNTKLGDLYNDLRLYLTKDVWKEEVHSPPYVNVHIVDTYTKLNWVYKKINRSKLISLDIETDGLSNRILTIAVSFPDETSYEGYCIPVFHPQGVLNGSKVVEYFQDFVIARPDLTILGHYIKYDISRLLRGREDLVPLCQIRDTICYDYMLDEHSQNRTLDFLSKRYTDFWGYKEKVDRMNLISFPIEDVAEYNVIDTITPPIIRSKLVKQLQSQGSFSSPLIEWYSRISGFVSKIEASGFKVDLDRLASIEGVLTTQAVELSDFIRGSVDLPELNLESPAQLSTLLYTTIGIKPPNIKDVYNEKSEQYSTRKEVLEQIKDKHEIIPKILKYKRITKQLKTFINGPKGIRNNLQGDFVYPEFFIVKSPRGGTVSGRFAAKNPAMQTILPDLRVCFISRYDNGLILGIDGDQMELRVGANESLDSTLLSVFNQGLDPHQATADICEVSRPIGKRINLAGIYGISINGLVEKCGLDYPTAQKVYRILKDQWQRLYGYLNDVAIDAVVNKQVRTKYNRVRRFPGLDPSTPEGQYMIREAQNFMFQSVASDIVQLFGWGCMISLQNLALPVMTNHDGVEWDLREGNIDEVLGVLESEVANLPELLLSVLGYKLDLPLTFTVKVGKNWGEQIEIAKFSTRR